MHQLRTIPQKKPEPEQLQPTRQGPGDLLILSSADTELSCIAQARTILGASWPVRVRLANPDRLGPPQAIDAYVERMAGEARVIIARLLGGASYWPHGVARLTEAARAHDILFAALPGDDRADPGLVAHSTVQPQDCTTLWRYCTEGGISNARNLLLYTARLAGLAGAGPHPEPPTPMPRAGLYDGATAASGIDRFRRSGPPVAVILFYRSLLQAGDLAAIDSLVGALTHAGLRAAPIFLTSLRDPVARGVVETLSAQLNPAVILSCLAFAGPRAEDGTVIRTIAGADCPVLQCILSGAEEENWRKGLFGLSPREIAMHVALPELDGRILTSAVAFKDFSSYDALCEITLARMCAVPDRMRMTAATARAWAGLRDKSAPLRRGNKVRRRIAVLLGNTPGRDGRIGNGVGLDAPASVIGLCAALRVTAAPRSFRHLPRDTGQLMARLQAGPTGEHPKRIGPETVLLPLSVYRRWLTRLPTRAHTEIHERWGGPEEDPMVVCRTGKKGGKEDCFALPVLQCGDLLIAIQPARAHEPETRAARHDPGMPPPHGYLAFYLWLRRLWRADAIIHMGKHGTLEWLPGKALALSGDCWPEIVGGTLPVLYPFIVNDPGEGTQAKRRSGAVIIDHMTPPLTRAGLYGQLAEIERLLDEHHEAASLDPRRVPILVEEIRTRAHVLGLDEDCRLEGRTDGADNASAPAGPFDALEAHLCDLKELQIRDGLHVFGVSPDGERLAGTLLALARTPRLSGVGRDASILRALALDLRMGDYDPLASESAAPWVGPRPPVLADLSAEPWRHQGDTLERLEMLALLLITSCISPIAGKRAAEYSADWPAVRSVLDWIEEEAWPRLLACGEAEWSGLLAGLAGRFVAPGPSGAPSRGRIDVLPTGRNFYSVDPRAIPTPAAWTLGWRSAQGIIDRYFADHGKYPRAVALSAWGSSAMRTGGDDIAQALAFFGARPGWDETGRMTGFEIMPASVLGRPRIEVLMRISGFFRDAFPDQIALLDRVGREVAALDEPDQVNAPRACSRARAAELIRGGTSAQEAARRAGFRVFAAPPGGYGTGLQTPIESGSWRDEAMLAELFLSWGGQAYGVGGNEPAPDLLAAHLGATDAVLHNQDNREHDMLDSDDYWQFAGGLAMTVRHLTGVTPPVLHTDTSQPDHPVTRSLKTELARLVRGRLVNPRWIAGIVRHGYKGAFEIAASVDYLFAFAVTSHAVSSRHFDAVFEAFLDDPVMDGFFDEHNPAAQREIAACLAEARRRSLWRPRANHVDAVLARHGL